MVIIPRDKDQIPIEPCLDCNNRYVEDIWCEDMCDKVNSKDINKIIISKICKFYKGDKDEEQQV